MRVTPGHSGSNDGSVEPSLSEAHPSRVGASRPETLKEGIPLPRSMPLVTARVNCFPTEDPERVRRAILNIFPESDIEELEDGFFAKSHSIDRFKEVLRGLQILDTARSMLRKGKEGNRTSISLNKQVAFMGKVSFVEESVPLGAIDLVIEDDEIDKVIDDIAPKTVDGEIP